MEVEREGSISKAAEKLYMAQPNLSKALKELEKDLGFCVFQRTATGVKVTENGAEFLYYARHVMEQLDAMERIGQREGGDVFKYKISIPRGSYIANGFTTFVSELQAKKGVEITVNETNAFGTIVNVADRGYNMGIIRYQVKDEDYYITCLKNNHLAYETIWEFEYVLVMSAAHPLAQKEEITVEDLKEYTKITHGDIDIPHERSAEKVAKANTNNVIYVYERGSQFDLLTNVPSTYMWVSPIPQSVLDKNRLVQRTCKVEENLYKDVLIRRSDYRLDDADRMFQKKIYEAKVDVASMEY